MSVYLSDRLTTRMEKLDLNWADSHEILYLNIFFSKFVEKIQVSLKCDKNNGHFT